VLASDKSLPGILTLRPRNAEQLHRFTRRVLGVHVARRRVIEGHAAPFDYLAHAFLEPGELPGDPGPSRSGDAVVWASRGGGKTLLGALATALDLLFKPGVQVRVLGGSFDQSARMYAHLRRLFDRPLLAQLLAEPPTRRRLVLRQGSAVELLSQSQTSVRGCHVHKLRCDEVDLFDPEVWRAAQLITHSALLADRPVAGAVEALSTLHRPFGLMHDVVAQAQRRGAPVFRWSALDVAQRCPPERPCPPCPLWSDCLGHAKQADGHLPIDDLIALKARSPDALWQAEMLCRRPQRDQSVYPAFDPQRHCPPHLDTPPAQGDFLIAGMDFGMRSPLVMLLARVVKPPNSLSHAHNPTPSHLSSRVEVLDEYLHSGLTLHEHLDRIHARDWPLPRWVGVDPAGRQTNSHSGLSDIQLLQRRGYHVRSTPSRLLDGIQLVRHRLERGSLLIAPRCQHLIHALTQYHFDPDRPHLDSPVKDGPDHACDALRYLLINLDRACPPVTVRFY
jgi:hypothetical protein